MATISRRRRRPASPSRGVEVVRVRGVGGLGAKQGGGILFAGGRAAPLWLAGQIASCSGHHRRRAAERGGGRMASNGGAESKGTATQALRRMAEAEPELAARLICSRCPPPRRPSRLASATASSSPTSAPGASPPTGVDRRSQRGGGRRRAERRRLRAQTDARTLALTRLGRQPPAGDDPRPGASCAASAARRWRCGGSARTRARASSPSSACRWTPTCSTARSPTRSTPSGPGGRASGSATSWSARAAAPGPSWSMTAASAASAAWTMSPSRWCGFATRTG